MRRMLSMARTATLMILVCCLLVNGAVFHASAEPAVWTSSTGAIITDNDDGTVTISNAHAGAQAVVPPTNELAFTVMLPAAIPRGEWGRLLIGKTPVTGAGSGQSATAINITFGNLDQSPIMIKIADTWSPLIDAVSFQANKTFLFRLKLENSQLVVYINDQKVLTSSNAALATLLNGTDPIYASIIGGGTQPVSYVVGMPYQDPPHAIHVSTGLKNGSIQVEPAAAQPGDTVVVRAVPAPGYQLRAGSLCYTFNETDFVIYKRKGSLVYDGAASNNETNIDTFFFTMPDGDVTIQAEFLLLSQPNLAVFGASYRPANAETPSGLQFGSRVYRKQTTDAGTWTLDEFGTLLVRKDMAGGLDLQDGEAVENWIAANPSKGRRVRSTQLMDRCTDYVDYAVRLINVVENGLESAEYVAIAYAVYSCGQDSKTVYSAPLTRSYHQLTELV